MLEEFFEAKRDLGQADMILLRVQQITGCTCGMIKDEINTLFRYFHSIKRNSKLLDLNPVVAVSESAETLLDVLKTMENDVLISDEVVDVLLQSISMIEALIDKEIQSKTDESLELNKNALLVKLQKIIYKITSQKTTDCFQKVDLPVSMAVSEDDFLLIEHATRLTQESIAVIHKAEEALINLIMLSRVEEANSISIALQNIHYFKGNCGLMQLYRLEKLSDLLERYLEKMSSQNLRVSGALIKTMLRILDYIIAELDPVSCADKAVTEFDDLYGLFKHQLEEAGGEICESVKSGIHAQRKKTTSMVCE